MHDLSKKKMSAMQDSGASVVHTLSRAACKNKETVSREDLEVLQFTCFTSAKVQILTHSHPSRSSSSMRLKHLAAVRHGLLLYPRDYGELGVENEEEGRRRRSSRS